MAPINDRYPRSNCPYLSRIPPGNRRRRGRHSGFPGTTRTSNLQRMPRFLDDPYVVRSSIARRIVANAWLDVFTSFFLIDTRKFTSYVFVLECYDSFTIRNRRFVPRIFHHCCYTYTKCNETKNSSREVRK